MGPAPDPLGPLIEALHAHGRLRVWSLVVTVFGDAVAPRGGRIATARLGEITARVGVGEGALRTALSRLVAEGTLERDREGRASFHRLSEGAAREAAAASAVIYGPGPGPDGWPLGPGPGPPRALVLPDGAWLTRDPPPAGAVAVTGRLSQGAAVTPEPTHARALAALRADLHALPARPSPPEAEGDEMRRRDGSLAPIDAMAARTLLVHRWRRIALRWPDLPGGGADRAAVAAAHRRLSPASERWLDEAIGPGIGSGAAVRAEDRFG